MVCFTFILSVVVTTHILNILNQPPDVIVQDKPHKENSAESVWSRDPDYRHLLLNYLDQGHQGHQRSLMEKEGDEIKHVTSERDLIGGEEKAIMENKQELEVVYDERKTMDPKERWTHCLKIKPNGRLGNKLFAYAALIGIAQKNFMWHCFPKDDVLWNLFNLKANNVTCDFTRKSVEYVDTSPYVYQEDTRRLNCSVDIELVGYFHSWKYFEEVKPLIREQFTFKETVSTAASQFLHLVMDKVQKSSNSRHVVPVGIHIRLGDMQDYYNRQKGYTVVSLEYIDAAMTYFLATYGPKGLVFIVCSDDIQYTRGKLTSLTLTSQVPTFYADDMAFLLELAEYSPVPGLNEAAVQLCLLSLCKHNIISTGSFSWWSGWLSNGTVIYSKNFPRPYSELDRVFDSLDYFPPKWIGLDI